ncbi:MAG: hypothetical protein CL917_07540 [Deltaproteobacteria bacterium]|nr:hypothetical protein [Deltaproteobacteria bacterium]
MNSLEFRLAWRSLGRNPRRTGLTLAATSFAMMLVVNMTGLSNGSHEEMVENGVRMASGHLSLMAPDHLEERTLEQPLAWTQSLRTHLESVPDIKGFAPRMDAFALVSHEESAQGMLIRGSDPTRENTVSEIEDRLTTGRFLRQGESREIVLGQKGAQTLGVELGDQVLLYGMAYSLESAYELFTVVGLVRFPDAELERTLAFISLEDAQAFFVYADRVTEVAILAEDSYQVEDLQNRLTQTLSNGDLRVHTWQEVVPELDQIIAIDKGGMYLILLLLTVVVGFGILNTILMAVLERKREFGILLALGLKPSKIFKVVYLESLLLAGVGIVIGLAISIPMVLYLQAHPIPITGNAAEGISQLNIEVSITSKFRASNPIRSTLIMMGVAVVAAFYPALKASRGQPIDVVQNA